MAKRVESPSSINTFKQCKRKYYYQYIEKLPTLSNIHQVRGNIAHSALELFYDIDSSKFNEDNYEQKFKSSLQQIFLQQWVKEKIRLDKIGLSKDRERFYFEETMLMLMNWGNHFVNDIKTTIEKKKVSIPEAFQILTPIREQEYRSTNYSVRGFIDAIQHVEEEVHIIDYKTNSKFDVKNSIRLQLAIYSLLYQEKHGKAPSKVGVFFLRHKLKMLSVDEELLKLAQQEIELIHAHTTTTEAIMDYSRTITPLCKWSTGQCDFYKTCKPHDN
ncbi:PD-(D/E)XK nuclease family protein [Candidatus Woesearchaeota archaeon]|jgi:RecB family exonuclease|nr:PD-(D/E)XK nuclease family protein [Candidatus Woesearchaeota archaeon]MBT5740161.1 PD-(D/E)XK nuclease family protein [Candidatus Woesearchaeota archaeon]